MLPRLKEGDRVELDFDEDRKDMGPYAGYGFGIVRGTVTMLDDPDQGDEAVCYYITYDTPFKLEDPGRYAMVNACATPVFKYVEQDCFHRHRLRKLSILELLAEAAT